MMTSNRTHACTWVARKWIPQSELLCRWFTCQKESRFSVQQYVARFLPSGEKEQAVTSEEWAWIYWHLGPRSSYRAIVPIREPTAIRRLDEQWLIWLKRHSDGNTSVRERFFRCARSRQCSTISITCQSINNHNMRNDINELIILSKCFGALATLKVFSRRFKVYF